MKKILIFVLVVFAALATLAFSETTSMVEKYPIRLSLKIKQEKIKRDEHLWFSVAIENTGDQELFLMNNMLLDDLLYPIMNIGHEQQGIYLIITDPHGKRLKGTRHFLGECEKNGNVRGSDQRYLQPGTGFKTATWAFNGMCGEGKKIGDGFVIRMGPAGYAELWNFNFDTPGKYHISAVYNDVDPCEKSKSDYMAGICKKYPPHQKQYGNVLARTPPIEFEVLP